MKLNAILLNEALDTTEKIDKWLKEMKIKNYSINNDLTVDVNGDVTLFQRGLTKLPVKFGKIDGNFAVRHNNLKSLMNFPKEVIGDLSVSHNPTLKNLQGADGMIIHGVFKCVDNNINTLEGISDSFSTVGDPAHHETIDLGSVYTYMDKIKSGGIGLMLIKNARMDIGNNDSNNFGKAYNIIRKYLNKPDKVFECQNELIDAGLDNFAQM